MGLEGCNYEEKYKKRLEDIISDQKYFSFVGRNSEHWI